MKATKPACKTITGPITLSSSRVQATRPWAQAMLEVLQRRGRNYGLLALYEESRLNVSR